VSVPRQYHFSSQTCNSCHADPHKTELACESCHTTLQWKVMRPFDHSTTKFLIDGAHQNVGCVKCHSPAGAGTNSAPEFAKTPRACFSCHSTKDVHGGQFRTAQRDEDCSSCHWTTSWDGKEFEHDKAQFALDVAHRNVACEKCHKETARDCRKRASNLQGNSNGMRQMPLTTSVINEGV
jgi:predicted CXXCH cytochrome family protein